MNILVLSTWYPFPADNGSRLRAFHLVRTLAERGHRIRLIAGVQSDVAADTAGPLTALCETVTAIPWRWHDGRSGGAFAAARGLLSATPRSIAETFTPAIRDAVEEECRVRQPDCLLVLEPGMDVYVPDSRMYRGPRVLDNAELSGTMLEPGPRRMDPRLRLRQSKARAYWRLRLGRYDAVTAVSANEVDVLRELLAGRTGGPDLRLVPNGVDSGAYDPADRHPVPGRLLYTGSLTYGPNRDAVLWFVRDILPKIATRLPEAHLVVTGRYDASDSEIAAALQDNSIRGRVRLTGFLPDLREELATAAVCVVPLLTGGGTRLKILEAWAASVPVVSTPVGAAGLDASDGVHLSLAAADPVTFADHVVRLLADPDRGSRIAASARRLAVERYDWSGIAGQLEEILVDGAVRSQTGGNTRNVAAEALCP